MIITRKLEIYVCEKNAKKKKEYTKILFGWRDAVRKAANLVVCHKFVQQNVKDFMYLKDDIRERFTTTDEKTGKEKCSLGVQDAIKEGKGLSAQNTTYRFLSSMLKGKMPSDIYSCLNDSISKTMAKTFPDINKGEATLRSYKNNIPIPFSANALNDLHEVEEFSVDQKTKASRKVKRYYFTLFGIPFAIYLRNDRSHKSGDNSAVIKNILAQKEYDNSNGKEGKPTGYKIKSSSISFRKEYDENTDKKKQKLFLYLCIDIPEKNITLNPDNKLYCYLGIAHPIVYNYEVQVPNVLGVEDKDYKEKTKWFYIGDNEEFTYRRTQIQEAIRRLQISCRNSKKGKGRKDKLQAIERFNKKEKEYVRLRLHFYSRKLIEAALKFRCSQIILVNQEAREIKAKKENLKGHPFVLLNWSYYDLRNMIEYKAAIYGIEVLPKKEKEKKEKQVLDSPE